VNQVSASRPLAGIRVLDLTRVLAGPTSTRWLAAFGATVLRIDPQHWDEPACTVEMSAGKRRAHLDLRNPAGKQQFITLLRDADVMVHGYRADALERLGLGDTVRRKINPGMIDVALCAYGWTGPWQYRRGFDSLVQMSSGIAHTGAELSNAEQPVPLPAQALDHATGYLMAASVVHALDKRRQSGAVLQARLSLARTAVLLEQLMLKQGGDDPAGALIGDPVPGDFQEAPEQTEWGPMQRLRWPVEIQGCQPSFDIASGNLRTSPAIWPG
jgi:crotonobetainyl-CoA:carnitine CoA-transferase CaiB-like acyl-CoA transferase